MLLNVATLSLYIVWKALISQGADIEAQGEDEWTPLMLASMDGNLSAVEVRLHLKCTFFRFPCKRNYHAHFGNKNAVFSRSCTILFLELCYRR